MSSIPISTSVSEQSRATSWGRFALVGVATAVTATIANVLVYFIGDLFVAYDEQFLILDTVEPVISVTLMASAVAVLLYAALLRFSRNPVRTFKIVATVVFVVTMVPLFTFIPTEPGVSNGQITIMALMHIVAALVIVPMLTIFSRPRSAAGLKRQASADR